MTRAMTAVILMAIAMAGVILVRGSGEEAGDGGAVRAAVQTPLWDRMQTAAGDAPIGEARAALRRSIRVARATPGRMPVPLQAKVRRSLGVPAGVPFENAHRLVTRRGALWLADLRRATCIVQARDGALACDTTAHVARRGLMLNVYAVTQGRLHDFVLFGLAPDDVHRARVSIGGRTREVAVHDNVYAVGGTRPIAFGGLMR